MDCAPTRIDLSSVEPHAPFKDRNCPICRRNWNPQPDCAGAEGVRKFRDILGYACNCCNCRYIYGLWSDASSWSQIVFLNYIFIKGVLLSIPWHFAPLDAESDGLIAGFKRLDGYGIITTGSQPYEHEIHINMPHLPSQVLESKQRPEMSFAIPSSHPLIPRSKVEALVQGLLNHPQIYATINSDIHDYPRSGLDVQGAQVVRAWDTTDELYSYRTSATELLCTVTKFRLAETEELLPEAIFQHATSAWGTYRGQAADLLMHDRFDEDSPAHKLGSDIELLHMWVFARAWDVDLERIYHDMDEWTTVGSEDSSCMNVMNYSPNYIGWENYEFSFVDGVWKNKQGVPRFREELDLSDFYSDLATAESAVANDEGLAGLPIQQLQLS